MPVSPRVRPGSAPPGRPMVLSTDWCTPSAMRATPAVAWVARRAAPRRSVARNWPRAALAARAVLPDGGGVVGAMNAPEKGDRALPPLRPRSEAFVRAQVAPLPHGQVAQCDTADTDAFQAHHLQAHLLAHAANLALLALGQHGGQLLGVLPFHLGGFQWLAVQAQTVAQAFEQFVRKNGLHVGADGVVLVNFLQGLGACPRRHGAHRTRPPISRAYSRMVRSLENLPIRATLRMDLRIQFG